ncbi:MAG: SDR family oxidoreductase [Pseudomonadota bacterium]
MGRETVLVTGVSRGIGSAIAARCSVDGFATIGLSRTPPETFHGEHYAVDLNSVASRDLLTEIANDHAPTRLVCNAGVASSSGILDETDESFERVMRVNVQSIVWAMQACIPHMKAVGFGRIVVIGSRAALGKRERIAYATSKAALEGLVRTTALEVGGDGITVNLVAPGPIETEMFTKLQPVGSDARRKIVDTTAVGRVGTPAEIASAVSYFLSNDAGFTTGQSLYVCGGMSVGAAR